MHRMFERGKPMAVKAKPFGRLRGLGGFGVEVVRGGMREYGAVVRDGTPGWSRLYRDRSAGRVAS